jgi:hypothetical protein
MKNKFKLLLEINQDQFDELKYLLDLQLARDTNLVKYNEDEELIESLKDLRKQLSYPNIRDE